MATRRKQNSTPQVLIVGAGPTGLIAACQLAKFGIPFRIIDKKATQAKHSKAIAIQPRTLELFEHMGIVDEVLKAGRQIPGASFVKKNGKVIPFEIFTTAKEFTPYSVFILEQHVTEKILIKHLKSLGHTVEWRTELTRIRNKIDGVKSTILNHKTKRTSDINSRFIIAADGASSTIRTKSHIDFSGGTYDQIFTLADVKITWPLSYKRLFIHFHKQGFLAFFPLNKKQTFRIITTTPPESHSKEPTFQEFASFVEKTFPLKIQISKKPIWYSIFKLHHRCVSNFRIKSCFFAGDAAHIHSPVGGQGMNTGIQDSYNLAWKIALFCRNQAHSDLINTYNEERLPFAKALLKTSDLVFRAAYKKRFKFKFFRTFIAPLVFLGLNKSSTLRKKFFYRLSQLWIHYEGTLAHKKFSSGFFPHHSPRPGERLPYLKIKKQSLYSLLPDNQYSLLIFTKPTNKKIQKILEYCAFNYPSLVNIQIIPKNETHSEIRQELGIKNQGMYLVRPDTYIALRSKKISLRQLKKYLKKFHSP